MDNAYTTMYQGTSTTATSAVLLALGTGCYCLLPTQFKRPVELMTQGIRMPSELEWVGGMTQEREQTFTEMYSAGLAP